MKHGILNRCKVPEQWRTALLWLFFLFWVVVIFFRLLQIMALNREEYLLDLEHGRNWRYETVSAARGRLLDADGRPLAWSTRHFALVWRVPSETVTAEEKWRQISEKITSDSALSKGRAAKDRAPGRRVHLIDSLTAEEFRNLQPLVDKLESVEIKAYFQRQRINHSRLRQLIGEVETKQGMEIGVSGWEQEHNHLLRGTPGVLKVRLDHQRRPIPETREIVRDLREGHDVYLPFRINSNN